MSVHLHTEVTAIQFRIKQEEDQSLEDKTGKQILQR